MKHDLLHLPGPPIHGCGHAYVGPNIPITHDQGDRIRILCQRCGKYGQHKVLGALRGLA